MTGRRRRPLIIAKSTRHRAGSSIKNEASSLYNCKKPSIINEMMSGINAHRYRKAIIRERHAEATKQS